MKKTGQLLKQKRESSSLSISEVALATKINPKVLIAIENGDEANLPAKTFLKGFVRSYALFLKMDVEDVLKCFVEDTGGPPPAPNHEAYQKDAQANRRGVPSEGSSGLRTAAIVVIVALICAIIGVRELVDKYQREKMAASTPADVKVSPLAESKPTLEAKADAKATPETETAAAAPTVTAETKAPPPDAPFESAVPNPLYAIGEVTRSAMMSVDARIPRALEQPFVGKHEPASVTAPKPALGYHLEDVPDARALDAKPPEQKIADAKPVVPAPEASSDAKPAAEAAAPKPAAGNEVIIEALDRVQVKVSLGADVRSVDLAPNDVHVVRATGPIGLDVSDGGAVSLVYNGRVRGVPGKLGEPKQVKIP